MKTTLLIELPVRLGVVLPEKDVACKGFGEDFNFSC